jgi:hypothetical protein
MTPVTIPTIPCQLICPVGSVRFTGPQTVAYGLIPPAPNGLRLSGS